MLFSNILNKATVTTSHIRKYNYKGANLKVACSKILGAGRISHYSKFII